MKNTVQHDVRQSARTQKRSADALGTFRQPLINYLVSGLENPDKWVRCLSADLLGSVKDPGAAGHLITLLTDADEDVRRIAAGSLDAIGHSRMAFMSLQRGGCDTCLIRIIAEEALSARAAGEPHDRGSCSMPADEPTDRPPGGAVCQPQQASPD